MYSADKARQAEIGRAVGKINAKRRSKERAAAIQRSRCNADGKYEEPLLVCKYCGATNVYTHSRRHNMCTECGKLYERWRKAVSNNIISELQLLKPLLLERYERGKEANSEPDNPAATMYEKILNTEVPEMIEQTHKVCKQCGRRLPVDNFRQYAARGRGVYNTKQGRYTICKDCESISNRAAAALRSGNQEVIDKLTEHYQALLDKGFGPVTAPARQLLGATKAERKSEGLDDMLRLVRQEDASELDEHCRLVRERGYASADEAYDAHKRLYKSMPKALQDELNELIEDWFDEEGE